MRVVGQYHLDTLQIFFAWDDDLYTHFRERGLGSTGLGSKKLPIIYTDNCESTGGVPERKRNNVIHPRFFGSNHDALKWKETKRETQPIIPAEKPLLVVSVSEDRKDSLVHLDVVPSIEGIEQYHLEYSSMSEFGRTYKNWATFYIPIEAAKELAHNLRPFSNAMVDCVFSEEVKQAQREKFRYLSVGVQKYVFSYSAFEYAKRYFAANGVSGSLPSLVYDPSDGISSELMDPVLKIGIIQTTTGEGFEERKAQVALKLSQPKFSITKRGVKGRMKGRIIENPDPANYVTVNAEDFSTKLEKVCETYVEGS